VGFVKKVIVKIVYLRSLILRLSFNSFTTAQRDFDFSDFSEAGIQLFRIDQRKY